jgi:hypothetical protein
MMRITKLLVLAAGVVVAACSGLSPTEPTAATVASDDATAIAEATAAKHAIDCRAITEVDLRLLPQTEPQYARIEAVYLKRGLPASCQEAPDWFSMPRDRIIQTRDPFIVKVFLAPRPPGILQVTAVAPNGVQGNIRVQ